MALHTQQAPTMTPAELRAAREAKGWTQTHLGAVVGVNRRTVLRWETGDSPISPAMARWLRDELEAEKEGLSKCVCGHARYEHVDISLPDGGCRLCYPKCEAFEEGLSR